MYDSWNDEKGAGSRLRQNSGRDLPEPLPGQNGRGEVYRVRILRTEMPVPRHPYVLRKGCHQRKRVLRMRDMRCSMPRKRLQHETDSSTRAYSGTWFSLGRNDVHADTRTGYFLENSSLTSSGCCIQTFSKIENKKQKNPFHFSNKKMEGIVS